MLFNKISPLCWWEHWAGLCFSLKHWLLYKQYFSEAGLFYADMLDYLRHPLQDVRFGWAYPQHVETEVLAETLYILLSIVRFELPFRLTDYLRRQRESKYLSFTLWSHCLPLKHAHCFTIFCCCSVKPIATSFWPKHILFGQNWAAQGLILTSPILLLRGCLKGFRGNRGLEQLSESAITQANCLSECLSV